MAKCCISCSALLAFLGDILASHLIGGFKEGISFALRIRRSCMITNDESSVVFSENVRTLRTPDSYERHCLLLEAFTVSLLNLVWH